jgi:hypothetical protein
MINEITKDDIMLDIKKTIASGNKEDIVKILTSNIDIVEEFNIVSSLLKAKEEDLFLEIYKTKKLDVSMHGHDYLMHAMNNEAVNVVKCIINDVNFKNYHRRNSCNILTYLKVDSPLILETILYSDNIIMNNEKLEAIYIHIIKERLFECFKFLLSQKDSMFFYSKRTYINYLIKTPEKYLEFYASSKFFNPTDHGLFTSTVFKDENVKLFKKAISMNMMGRSTVKLLTDSRCRPSEKAMLKVLLKNKNFKRILKEKDINKIKDKDLLLLAKQMKKQQKINDF